jgi:hypothetical protein
MTPLSLNLPHTARPREQLSNWLALLALLAGGLVWGPADAAPLERCDQTCGCTRELPLTLRAATCPAARCAGS